MEYKLLILDIDGTLLNEEKKVTAYTKAILVKMQQLGVKIVLASGRPTHGVLPIAQELELDKNGGYILSYNGAQITDLSTHELLFDRRIDPSMLPYLERKAKKNNFPIFTYYEDTILTNDANNKWIHQEASLNGMQIKEVSDFAGSIHFSPYKCMLVSDDEEALLKLENHWKKRLAGSLDVFRSEPYFLEIVPEQIDKANTLSILLERLRIKPENIIAIGDGVCDVTMIQLAGLGVAMGNAQESVKSCADYITRTNEEDGVAHVVEKYILSAIRPTEIPLDQINASSRHGLVGHLGIQFTYVSENRIEATMPVDLRTRQPFGVLHGGATLALAETVAGLGSMIICKPDEKMVGMQVSGNHVSSAHEGNTVRAIGTIIHKGQSSHVWNVDVYTSTDKLVSSIRVLNSIMRKR